MRFGLFAGATTATAAQAGKDENKPDNITAAAAVHYATAHTAEAVEQKHKQYNIAAIASASVCTVCKETVHNMYLLQDFGFLLHYLTQPFKFVLLRH